MNLIYWFHLSEDMSVHNTLRSFCFKDTTDALNNEFERINIVRHILIFQQEIVEVTRRDKTAHCLKQLNQTECKEEKNTKLSLFSGLRYARELN